MDKAQQNSMYLEEQLEDDLEKIGNMQGKEYFFEYGKREINNLIWVIAPGHLTLDEAEKLSISLYETLAKKWEEVEDE